MSTETVSNSNLEYLLRTARQLSRLVFSLRTACLWVAGLLIAGLVAIVADGLLGFPGWALIGVDLLAIAALLLGVGCAFRELIPSRVDPRSTARAVEHRLGRRDNAFINAWDLSSSASPAASAALVRRSVEAGNQLAFETPMGRTLPVVALFRALRFVLVVLLAGVVCWLAMPGLFAAVLPRFLDPRGDHPPFTLVEFAVQIEPSPLYAGRAATVRVHLGGPELIERGNLVFVEPRPAAATNGRPPESIPLLNVEPRKFLAALSPVDRNREFYIDTPRGRSNRFKLEVLAVPIFETAEAKLRFPEYTGWPETKQSLALPLVEALQSENKPSSAKPPQGSGQSTIQALIGTQVELRVTSNMPLKSGTIEIRERVAEDNQPEPAADAGLDEPPADGKAVEKKVPPRVIRHELIPTADGRTAAGSFAVEFNAVYEVLLTGTNGAVSPQKLEGVITAIPDVAPRVDILEPQQMLLAVEGFKINVRAIAQDDIGVAEMKLERKEADGSWTPLPAAVEFTQKTLATAGFEFDLGTLGTKAGESVTYRATAADNHPQRQSAGSAEYTIRVIKEEEYLALVRGEMTPEDLLKEVEELQKRQEELSDRRKKLDELAEALKQKLNNEGDLTPDEQQQELAQLQKELEKYAEDLETLARDLEARADQPKAFAAEEEMAETLRKLSQEKQEQAAEARSAAENARQLGAQSQSPELRAALQQALEEMAKQGEAEDQESLDQLQRLTKDLESLKHLDQMQADAEQLNETVEKQEQLAEEFKKLEEPSKMTEQEKKEKSEELARQQEQMAQEVDELARRLEQAAEQTKESLPRTSADAKELAQKLGEMQVSEDQRQAARDARAGQGKSAGEKAGRAAENLKSLQKESQQGEGEGGEMPVDAGLSLSRPGMQQTLKQLSQARQSARARQKSGQQPGEPQGQPQPGQSGKAGREARQSIGLAGPHVPRLQQQRRQAAREGNDGDGPSKPGSDQMPLGVESLTPGSQGSRGSATGQLRGVPVKYRDQAAAFFERLARERAGQKP